jgi:putative FmdB family regulatory protein
MPIYLYVCPRCGRAQDEFAPIAERHTAAPECHGQMQLEITATMVQADIEPYIAVGGDVAGKPIRSRKEHREFLKRNHFVELGNEPIRAIKNDFRPKRGEIRDELKQVIPEVIKRHRG